MRVTTNKGLAILAAIFLVVLGSMAEDVEWYTGPIIDMHLHSSKPEYFQRPRPNPATGEISVTDITEHAKRCVAYLEKNNVVVAMVDGVSIDPWEEQYDHTILRGFDLFDFWEKKPTPEQFRDWIKEGRFEVFGELGTVYAGIEPTHPRLMPFYEICEKMDIPVAIHTGGSFPGITEHNTRFRLRLGDPFLIEDVLVKHPKLRVYLMHAGGHFYERAAMLMKQYPNLYVDIGVLSWLPDAQDFLLPFIKRAKAYDLLERVMFGTDQMAWPEAIDMAIKNVNAIEILTPKQKADIFYNNAARFLKLSEEQIQQHLSMGN